MSLKIFIYGEDGFTNSTLASSLLLMGLDVIGTNDNEKVALRLISEHQPDVVVMHIEYARIKAIELAQSIRNKFPKIGIVLIAKTEDIRLLGVSKKELPKGVIVAKTVRQGDLDSLKEKIELSIKSTDHDIEIQEVPYLTDLQIETIRLLAAGKANSEIAKSRFVSEKSVEQMLSRIASMLGISFDHEHNSRVRILNSYYELINGRK
jgi:DNA-binding NarL/FixJ family response regulator